MDSKNSSVFQLSEFLRYGFIMNIVSSRYKTTNMSVCVDSCVDSPKDCIILYMKLRSISFFNKIIIKDLIYVHVYSQPLHCVRIESSSLFLCTIFNSFMYWSPHLFSTTYRDTCNKLEKPRVSTGL